MDPAFTWPPTDEMPEVLRAECERLDPEIVSAARAVAVDAGADLVAWLRGAGLSLAQAAFVVRGAADRGEGASGYLRAEAEVLAHPDWRDVREQAARIRQQELMTLLAG